MPDLLDSEDLAYMRATQASARPTEAHLRRKVTTRTPTGGTTVTHTDPGEPVAVRIAAMDPTQTPEGGADYQVRITLDLVADVRDGDLLQVSPTEVYELTTDGVLQEWTTAQVVYGRRVAYRSR